MKTIKISTIEAMLEEGKDRKQIKEELDLKPRDMKALFNHPKLKNKRPKAQLTVVIEDDIPVEETQNIFEEL